MKTNTAGAKAYLDYAATTPLDQSVLDVMLPFFKDNFGNTSSIHTFGQKAEAALQVARQQMAVGLNCDPTEVIFTACGSESDNLALRGTALAARRDRAANHILISPVEHHAISRTAEDLANNFDFEVEYLPIDQYGIVSPEQVDARIRPNTAVVSVIYANNEIGTINPISEIGTVCKIRNIPFHSDAIQAAAYLPVDVEKLNVDLLSLGAHKFYGPKGIGALYIRSGTPIQAILTGGGQEKGLRPGTHNTAFIVGMAHAFQLAQENLVIHSQRLLPLRNRIIESVLNNIPNARLTGHPTERMPNHASFVFKGIDGNTLLMLLDVEGFACSSGSACKTGDPEPSEVLTKLGLPREWALGSLRVTLGVETSPAEVEAFIHALPEIVARCVSVADDMR